MAEAFDEPEPEDKPKGPPGSRGSHPIAGRRPLRFAGNVRPVPVVQTSAQLSLIPTGTTGMSRSAASAYAYAVEPSGRHRW